MYSTLRFGPPDMLAQRRGKYVQSKLRGEGKCKFPFDYEGRVENLRDDEKPEWLKVVAHFLQRELKASIELKDDRYKCNMFPSGCIGCPAYRITKRDQKAIASEKEGS